MKNVQGKFKYYIIQKLLGRGGMAEVFLAEDMRTKRQIAIKIVPMAYSKDPNYKKRFLREFKSHANLDHKNIVKVLDGGEHRSQLYMAMDFIDGWSLDKLIMQFGTLPIPVAIYIIRETLQALRYTHEKGIVHRDIKPANILVSKEGEVKVTDFGIVKAEGQTMLTQAGDVLGTPAYMSPEQILGREVDHTTDLYSCGIVIYEMLTGTNPNYDDNVHVSYTRALKPNFPPVYESIPIVSDDLEDVMAKIRHPSQGSRYRSVGEVLLDLTASCQEYEILATREAFVNFTRNSEQFKHELDQHLSTFYFDRGKETFYNEKDKCGLALLDFYRATLADRDFHEAKRYVQRICRKKHYHESTKMDPEILMTEEKLIEDPNNYFYLMKLVKQHQAAGNFIEAIRKCRQILRVKPNDIYAEGVLNSLLLTPVEKGMESIGDSSTTIVSNTNKLKRPKRKRTPPPQNVPQNVVETVIRRRDDILKEQDKAPTQATKKKSYEDLMDQMVQTTKPQSTKRDSSVSPFTEIRTRWSSMLLPYALAVLFGCLWMMNVFSSSSGTSSANSDERYQGPSLFNLTLAERAARQKNYELALQQYNRFIDSYTQNPVFIEAQLNMGKLYIGKGDFQKAMEAFTTLARNYPRSEFRNEALREKARLLLIEGKIKEVLATYEDIFNYIHLTPISKRKAELLKEYVDILESQNHRNLELLRVYNYMLDNLQNAIPYNKTLYKRGVVKANLNQHDAALTDLKRIIRLAVEDPLLQQQAKDKIVEISRAMAQQN